MKSKIKLEYTHWQKGTKLSKNLGYYKIYTIYSYKEVERRKHQKQLKIS